MLLEVKIRRKHLCPADFVQHGNISVDFFRRCGMMTIKR